MLERLPGHNVRSFQQIDAQQHRLPILMMNIRGKIY